MSKFLDNTGLTYLWSKIKATARNVVHVGTTAPTDDIAQVWINPDGETTVTVPTVSEMNAALAEKRDKTFNIVFTEGEAEDPAYYDEESDFDCDKTIDEIKAAFEAGKEIKAYYYDAPMETEVSNWDYLFSVTGKINGTGYFEQISYSYKTSTSKTSITYSFYNYIANKTIESQPTANSTNLVTSGGVAAALDGKIDKPANPATGAFLTWNGSAWVAQTLSEWQGGSY